MRAMFVLAAVLAAGCPSKRADAPRAPRLDLTGSWGPEQSQPLVDKTMSVRLAPDLSHLSAGERAAVDKLLQVGAIFQELYEDQRHLQAPAVRAALAGATGPGADNLRQLYRLFQGPIATTLDNERVAFVPVDEVQPGKTVYPWKITRDEIEAFLAAHPDAKETVLHPRTVVRRATEADLARDLAALDRHPALDTLHSGLRDRLEALRRAPEGPSTGLRTGLYAVPYSVAYADRLIRAHALIAEAADLVEGDDPELAGYLRNRGRDLLTDDYESGDAAWVTARFKNLNAQIGSYETYDDELYGTKTFFSLSLLALRPDESAALRDALGGLQAFEDALPYQHQKRVRERIPVGVYDVIADFGQARGGNTASILPNEAYLTQRYGRTILLRANIMRDPAIFSDSDRVWESVVAPAHAADLVPDGGFYRTLWHEVGHYLGVDTTEDGRDLDTALQDASAIYEEMKADLVALFVADALRASGYYDEVRHRGVLAAGVMRVIQNNKPRRDQPYNTMQLMQWNYFLEQGLLGFDAAAGVLTIDHAKYHDAVAAMLGEVLALQRKGDKAAADAFIDRYATWDDALHGVIARKFRDQQRYRFRLFTYEAID